MKLKFLIKNLLLSSCLLAFSVLAKELELTTAVSGVVDKVMVKQGSKVKQGDLLLTLDQGVLAANLEYAKKHLHSMTLHNEEAQKELERTENLYEQLVISDHELKIAKINAATAEAELAKAKKSLEDAAFKFKYSQITAPVDGMVASVNAWPGMVVNNELNPVVLIKIQK